MGHVECGETVKVRMWFLNARFLVLSLVADIGVINRRSDFVDDTYQFVFIRWRHNQSALFEREEEQAFLPTTTLDRLNKSCEATLAFRVPALLLLLCPLQLTRDSLLSSSRCMWQSCLYLLSQTLGVIIASL